MKVGRSPGREEVEAREASSDESAGTSSEQQAQGDPSKHGRVILPPTSSTQRMLILDCWQRSGLKAPTFSELVGVSAASLYAWRRMFDEEGPAGLESRPRGVPRGSKLPETTQRAILMLKRAHPEWGCERLSDVLLRSSACAASAGAISHYLKEQGYTSEPPPESEPHEPPVRRFERARVNQLWQSDLFTFLLKPEPRRVYLVIFMDDHSRFIASWGLSASASGSVVREALLAGIANFGAPEEVLTDNGPQYVTWRGVSAFAKLLQTRGIRHVVARPRHPQTLGKAERFWGSLWRECLQPAIFRGLDDARQRVGLFIDHYNFHRPHRGLDGLAPADRFFESAPEVLRTLRARVSPKSAELARDGAPRKSFYLTGRIGDAGISVHAEGERIVLTTDEGQREEVDLGARGRRMRDDEEEELPEVVTPEARCTEVDDDDEQDGQGGDETAGAASGSGDKGEWDPDGEEDGGGRAGGAGGLADAGVCSAGPGGFDGTLLPAGNAGAAGAGVGTGAAGERAADDAAAADDATRAGEAAARARALTAPGAGPGGAAGDRDQRTGGAAEGETEA
jgi:transposase InsO family protein